nr:AraC family transcriptional regulator N-terminal domain-containing protein [Calditrichia bacterium]
MNPSQQLELKTLIDKFSNGEGIFPTPVPGITLIKYTALHSFMPMVYDPSLCLVVQGRKEVLLEKERFRYTP